MPNKAGDQGAVCTDANTLGFAGQPFGGGDFQTASAFQITTGGLAAGAGKLPDNPTSGYAGADLWLGGGSATAGNANGGSVYIQCGALSGSGTVGGVYIVNSSGTTFATFDNAGSLTIATGTVTTSTPSLNLSQTWNSGGVTFSACTITVTDTASAAASYYFSVMRGATRWFNLQKGTFAAYADYPYLSYGTDSYRGFVAFVQGGVGIGRLNATSAYTMIGADITNGTTGVVCVGANGGAGLKGKIGFVSADPFQAEPDAFISRAAAGVIGLNASTTVGGSLACTATTTAISANTDNLALNASEFHRMNCTSACNLTGVAPPSGTSHVDGRVIELINVGTQNLTFKHNTTSTAANRFFCSTGADLVCAPNQRIRARYDSTGADNATQAGWRIFLNA